MNCPFCKNGNYDGADVCEHCGESLEFLSQPSVSSNLETSLLRDRVAAIMDPEPVVVGPARRVRDVLDLLVDSATGCVVVVEGDRIVGVFTERDALLRLNTNAAALGDRSISDFMTPSPETVTDDAEIAFALHKMDIGGYRHLPVVCEGKLAGVISTRAIFQYIGSHLTATE